MAFKSFWLIVLTAKLYMTDYALGSRIRFVNDYDIDHYIIKAEPRLKRDLNDFEYLNKGNEAGFIPEYLKVFDMIMPEMKKMEIVKGNLFLPRSMKNYSPEDVSPPFIKSEQMDSSQEGYVNEKVKETYQAITIEPEAVLTENPINAENETPDPHFGHPSGNPIDWNKGGNDVVALNTNSDGYDLVKGMNSNINQEIFNINELETRTDSPEDGVLGCYNQCLQNCYGTGSTGPRSYYESGLYAKPLIINIRSESCMSHPSQRFHQRNCFKPKLNPNSLKFHSPPRKIPKYSSCPYSEIPPFYY